MSKETSAFLASLYSLEGKVGIVTGASKGIGEQIAHVLAEAGARIYDLSRTENSKRKNDNIIWKQVDISDYRRVKSIIAETGEKEGIDFLINNAGITKRVKAEEVNHEWWDKIHEVNVDALFFTSQAAYPYLKKAKENGRIINISSMASYMGFTEVTPYCSTKAAVCGITRGLAVEWSDDNILVNSISPGWFKSEMNTQVVDEVRDKKIRNKIALSRYGDLKEIAYMAHFLLSKGAMYITGQDFSVDGGARVFGY